MKLFDSARRIPQRLPQARLDPAGGCAEFFLAEGEGRAQLTDRRWKVACILQRFFEIRSRFFGSMLGAGASSTTF